MHVDPRLHFIIVDTTRNHVLLLISCSYAKIRLEGVSSLTGLSGPDLLQSKDVIVMF